jgi:dTDP-4-amino-4,6-dideoxygalactose transaminase
MSESIHWPINQQNIVTSLQQFVQTEKWWSPHGRTVKTLEQRFAENHDTHFGIAACNGTILLKLVLQALGIGTGDKVILPAYNYYALPHCVEATGATPVFVDVQKNTVTIDVEEVSKALDPHVKAVIAVHIDSVLAPLDTLATLCHRHQIYLIEDCSQAHGAVFGNRKVGSWGIAGVFSCGGSKLLTAGQGGMLITSEELLYQKCFALVNRGRQPDRLPNAFQLPGENYQLSELAATLLLPQLFGLEKLNREYERMMRFLDAYLTTTEVFRPLVQLSATTLRSHLRYSFFYKPDRNRLMPARNALLQHAQKNHIPLIRGYHCITEDPRLFQRYSQRSYPNALYAQEHIVSVYHHHLLVGEMVWKHHLTMLNTLCISDSL